MAEQERKQTGRPTKYSQDLDEKVFNLCLLGMTDAEIIKHWDIADSTFHLWKLQHPSFSEAVHAGREPADAEVIRSLRQRALGFTIEEEQVLVVAGKIKRVKVKKYYPPDVKAAEIWARNRQRARWSMQREDLTDTDKTVTVEGGLPRNFKKRNEPDVK